MVPEKKADNIIWWLMITFASVIILGGGAWAATVNNKMEKIITLEANVQTIQTDLAAIKNLIITVVKRENYGQLEEYSK